MATRDISAANLIHELNPNCNAPHGLYLATEPTHIFLSLSHEDIKMNFSFALKSSTRIA